MSSFRTSDLHHALDASAAEPHVHGTGAGAAAHAAHTGAVGTVDPRVNGFDPQEILRDFDEGRVVGGVREWELVAEEKEIEVAPGVKYAAWAYNGRVPGPTLRAREGERLRIRFTNGSKHPHTIHFHGIHTAPQDGVAGPRRRQHRAGQVDHLRVRRRRPFGLHLYHCHTMPLAEHIAKGLYGAFIIDPKNGRPHGRRARDGDERVRHQLRPLERGLRGQHRRVRIPAPADEA